LFISDTDTNKKTCSRTAIIYLAATAFCGFFSSVYGKYSHGVSSDYMVFLCLIPLIFGVLPYTALYCFNIKAPNNILRQIYNCGVATISVGSCLAGVFEIYGSGCVYVPFYFYIGVFLMAASVIAYLIKH